jgi:hypothetical protein
VRYAVRAKVAQLMAAGGVAMGLAGLGATDLSLLDAAVLAAIVAGSIGGSLSLWCAPWEGLPPLRQLRHCPRQSPARSGS